MDYLYERLQVENEAEAIHSFKEFCDKMDKADDNYRQRIIRNCFAAYMEKYYSKDGAFAK